MFCMKDLLQDTIAALCCTSGLLDTAIDHMMEMREGADLGERVLAEESNLFIWLL